MKYFLAATKNYNMFEMFEVNRSVHEHRKDFQKILRSMKAHGYIAAYPLHCVKGVGNKLKVKAGHNRLTAAMALGLPVYYVVCDDTASIYELEAGPGKWKAMDYLESFYKKGYPAYVTIKQYMDKTGISLSPAASMFYGQQASSGNWIRDESFRAGTFAIRDYNHPEIVGSIVTCLRTIGIDFAQDKNFVSALSKVVLSGSFDISRFIEKSKKYPQLFQKQRGMDEYLRLIEEVYNYHSLSSQKINVAFLAQQAAEARKDSFSSNPYDLFSPKNSGSSAALPMQ